MKTNYGLILLVTGAVALVQSCAFAPARSSYTELPEGRPALGVSKSQPTITTSASTSALATVAPIASPQHATQAPEPALLDVPPFGLRVPDATSVTRDLDIHPLTQPEATDSLKSSPALAQSPVITDFSAAGRQPFALSPDQQLNRVDVGKIYFAGSFVEAYKARNPLQVLNPFAARDLGSVEGNLTRDPVSSRISGLKFFSIGF
jgi:hypothetical protein